MSLSSIQGKRKKKKTRVKIRSGLDLIPVDKGHIAVLDYFQFHISRKDIIEQIKKFVKNNFSKIDAKKILSHPEWRYYSPYFGGISYYYNHHPENIPDEIKKTSMKDKLTALISLDNNVVKETKEEEEVNKILRSPADLFKRKIDNTIMSDLDDWEDNLISNKYIGFDMYSLFHKHGLKASAIGPVKQRISLWLNEYEDAYYKRCDQAAAAYSNIDKKDMKWILSELNKMLKDLESIKGTKKTRKKKIPSLEKQVSKVKYKIEDSSYKIVSIDPVNILNRQRVLLFDTKNRKILEYIAADDAGLKVKGTTINNFDAEKSSGIKLRKPLDILPDILNCTARQYDTLKKNIKSKPSSVSGRINDDIIILKVLK